MNQKEELIKIFSMPIRRILMKAAFEFDKLQEIRLRINRPLVIIYNDQEFFLAGDGSITEKDIEAYIVGKQEIRETMEYIGSYSLYAFEDEVRQGFITIQGGHRVGVAGKVVLENHKVKNIKHISFLNVRLSHQIKGCGERVLPFITEQKQVLHTLLISPPRCGKTTLLRDIVRLISNGTGYCFGSTVGVVDERSEIGGSYLGIPQNDLGIRTDILDCCPKAEGMMMLVRSMSPQVIVVDEIGDYEDIRAIETVIHCGCRLIATVHGSSIEDIRQKPLLAQLVSEKIFQRYVILENRNQVGNIKGIYNAQGDLVSRKEERLIC